MSLPRTNDGVSSVKFEGEWMPTLVEECWSFWPAVTRVDPNSSHRGSFSPGGGVVCDMLAVFFASGLPAGVFPTASSGVPTILDWGIAKLPAFLGSAHSKKIE